MVKVAVIGIVTVLVGIQLKSCRQEYANLLSVAGCLLIFLFAADKLREMTDSFHQIESYLHIQTGYLKVILKMIGIAYLAEFSASVCKDAGFGAVASQIELFAKLFMLTLSMPIILALFDTIHMLWN